MNTNKNSYKRDLKETGKNSKKSSKSHIINAKQEITRNLEK